MDISCYVIVCEKLVIISYSLVIEKIFVVFSVENIHYIKDVIDIPINIAVF